MRYAFGLLFLFFFSPELSASPAEEPSETRIPILDRLDDLVGNKINNVANDFDSFFATERADDELGRSRVRVRSFYKVQEKALPTDDIQVNFNMRLPYLEQRFKFEQEDRKVEKTATTDEEREQARLRRIKRSKLKEDWTFNLNTGVNVSLKPRGIARARARKNKQTGTLIHRFSHELSWRTDEQAFRQRTELSTDHKFSENLLFRFGNSVDWRISRKNFTTGHGPGLFQRISDYEALSYNLTMSTTVLKGSWYTTNYTLSTTYRRNLYRDMLYIDIVPGLDFPKAYSFRRTPFLLVQLEFLFGG